MNGSQDRELFDYGIHNEATHIRAHVGVIARTLYVFPTRAAISAMRSHPKRKAWQPHYNWPTAEGHIVPWDKIPHIRRVRLSTPALEAILQGFDKHLPTTAKGILAVKIVKEVLKSGRFPLWCDGELVTDTQLQIDGDDIYVRGKWKIQVKCDFDCGEIERGGTGNLFLQTAEINPFHHV